MERNKDEKREAERPATSEKDDMEKIYDRFAEEFRKKKSWITIAIKMGLVLAIFFLVFYLIYFSTKYGTARFALSNKEITEINDENDKNEYSFNVNDKVYFYLKREYKNLESALVVIEIEFNENGTYKHFKQITYEIDKEFPKLSSYVPEEYISRPGKYKFKLSIDGKVVGIKDVAVSK